MSEPTPNIPDGASVAVKIGNVKSDALVYCDVKTTDGSAYKRAIVKADGVQAFLKQLRELVHLNIVSIEDCTC